MYRYFYKMPRDRKYWSSWQFRSLSILCQAYSFTMITFVPSTCIYVIISSHTNGFIAKFSVCFAVYVTVNLVCNWICFKTNRGLIKSSQTRTHTDDILIVGNCDECANCNLRIPGNRHCHCPICKLCILYRDHHCFFLGGCVNTFNLLNFLSFCCHACIGCGYAFLLMMDCMQSENNDILTADFKYYIVPFAVAKWIAGHVSIVHLLNVLYMNLLFSTCLCTLVLFLFHTYLVFVSKTSYEFWHKQGSPCQQMSWRNFTCTLGKMWYVSFFLPCIQFENQQVDGKLALFKLI